MSKIEFARYFERIADWIVPHVAGRPLTLVHCPAGIAAPCHFLKHAKAWGPSALRRVRIQEKTKIGDTSSPTRSRPWYLSRRWGSSKSTRGTRPPMTLNGQTVSCGISILVRRSSWQQVVKGGRTRARGPDDAEAEIVGEDDRRPRAARGCSAQGQTHCRGMPRLLPCRQRSHRTCGSSRLYDGVREVRPRAQDPHRLPQKQPHQHVGVCLFAARASRGGGVDAARVERVASATGTLDDANGTATARSHPNGPMGRLLGRRSDHFRRVVRSDQAPFADLTASKRVVPERCPQECAAAQVDSRTRCGPGVQDQR